MNSDSVALWSLVLSSVATVTSCIAVIVAILDWQQVSREEPWSIEKLDDEHWKLRRNHRRPVFITSAYVFHHSGVTWINDAAFPALPFRRGTTAVVQIAPNPRGYSLTMTTAKARRGERTNTGFRGGLDSPRKGETPVDLPLY